MFTEDDRAGFKMDKKSRRKLALYIHIPFCIRKCLYCDFLSTQASDDVKEAYVSKVIQEVRYWQELCNGDYEVQTVFMGGGTPTCLSGSMLAKIGEAVLAGFQTAAQIEYTIEANPGTVSDDIIRAFQGMQVNRISLGLQSADDRELKRLGRIHTYQDFIACFHRLREQGFDNINIDLMADIPEQTMESYASTLEKVCRQNPEHISSYSLIVEEGTPFFQMQEKGLLEIPDEETDRQMYEMTECYLKEHDYQRYEISNYAKADRECRHNLTYWNMGEYLGIGLGASSFFRGYRFQNETDLKRYLERPIGELIYRDKHFLTQKEEMEEFVFLGLRKMNGISVLEFNNRFQTDFYKVYQKIVQEHLSKGLLAEDKKRGRIYLTRRGIDVSNVVLADFLF